LFSRSAAWSDQAVELDRVVVELSG